jgi:hypothetical protein
MARFAPNLSQLLQFVRPNAMLLASSMVVGAVIDKCFSMPGPVSRFPPGISSNLQLVTALAALEEVLPDARLMTNLVKMCESLCRLEFDSYSGAQYLATQIVSQIKQEIVSYRVIPYLTEDLPELEDAVMDAVRAVQTNISVNF